MLQKFDPDHSNRQMKVESKVATSEVSGEALSPGDERDQPAVGGRCLFFWYWTSRHSENGASGGSGGSQSVRSINEISSLEQKEDRSSKVQRSHMFILCSRELMETPIYKESPVPLEASGAVSDVFVFCKVIQERSG